MKSQTDIVLASDASFFPGLFSTITSIVLHDQESDLRIHLLDGGLADIQWELLSAHIATISSCTSLIRHRLNRARLEAFHYPSAFGLMNYARLLTPEFVPADFAIYVDADILVTKPLSSLQSLLGKIDKALYAVPENGVFLKDDCPWGTGQDLSKYLYINSGFMAMNLAKWRQEGIAGQLLKFLEKESFRCRFVDQSAINWLLRDDIGYLPEQWNVLSVSLDTQKTILPAGTFNLHFVSGLKPWIRPLPSLSHKIWRIFEQYWIPAAARTYPFRNPVNFLRYLRAFLIMVLTKPLSLIQTHERLRPWKQFWKILLRRSTFITPPKS